MYFCYEWLFASFTVAIKIISSIKIITRFVRKVSAPYDNHHLLRTNVFTAIVVLSIVYVANQLTGFYMSPANPGRCL